MKKFASPVTVTAVIVLTLAAYSEAKADTKHLEIRSSKQCPDGLVIQTQDGGRNDRIRRVRKCQGNYKCR